MENGAINAPVYTPNFKFKVMDRELEIEEAYRSIIKDAKTEAKVRELHEKAYGLDAIKPRYQDVREKYKSLNQEHTNFKGNIQKTLSKLERGDMDGFFNDVKIPREKIFQYVLDKLNYQNLPPEQQRMIDAQRSQEERAYQLELQNQELQQAYQHQAVQARTVEMHSALSRPNVKSVSDAFDAARGQGAFENEVIRRGQLAYYTTGKDITADQAVQEVLQLLGQPAREQTQAAPQQAAMNAQAQQAMNQPQAQGQRPPVIPAVTGRSTSPARRSPKSLDELRQMAKERSQ